VRIFAKTPTSVTYRHRWGLMLVMAGIFGIALVEMSPAFIAGYERPAVSLVGVMLLAGLGILVLLRIVTCAMHRVVSVGFVWRMVSREGIEPSTRRLRGRKALRR
jgi:membrane protein implicated in regulation of membrane protease activity